MKTLKNILLINALSSGATGILLIFFADVIAAIFENPYSGLFQGVGFFLVAFAILVFVVYKSDPISKRGVVIVTVLDVLWVVLSFAFVAFDGHLVSAIGNLGIILVALWVAAMALFQTRGMKALRTS